MDVFGRNEKVTFKCLPKIQINSKEKEHKKENTKNKFIHPDILVGKNNFFYLAYLFKNDKTLQTYNKIETSKYRSYIKLIF